MGVRETEHEDFGDEAEETLSFCDFVINSEDEKKEYYSEEGKSSSSSRDSFEFFGEDHCSALSSYPKDNVIFCGKRIPYGDQAVAEKRQVPDKRCKQQEPMKSKSRGEKTIPAVKYGDKFDFSVKEVSILATPVKSRWYLFVFGVGRFPMEMELRDMKMRQSRRHRVVTSKSNGGDEMMKESDAGKGLWRRLRRVMGFKTRNANTFFGCIQSI